MVGSASPRDGKSTISWHLAVSSARAGVNVLLVETDFHRPLAAARLGGHGRAAGLVDVLLGADSLSSAAATITFAGGADSGLPSPTHQLTVLPAGALPPNPAELLESQAMDELLAEARARFDLVIVDTPPLGAISDAYPLIARVDGLLLVGRCNGTHRVAAQRLSAIMREIDAPVLGVIVNGVPVSKSGSYYGKYRPVSAETRLTPQPLAATPPESRL